VNEVPSNLNLKITTTSLDWSALKGRVEINLLTNTSSVPFESVELVVLDNKGNEIYKRAQREVLPQMLLGFRTTNVKNGSYEMLYRGHITVQGKDQTVDTPKIKIAINN
jgi:hypothetical protein